MERSPLKSLVWSEARSFLVERNEALCLAIDACNPADDLKRYLAEYAYGDVILNQSDLYLPDSAGHLRSLSNASSFFRGIIQFQQGSHDQ